MFPYKDYRPVPLTEHIKVGEEIVTPEFQWVRNLNPLVRIPNDCDNLIYLCLETVIQGHSVLIFCPTKKWCETMATNISQEFCKLGLYLISQSCIINYTQLS